jgi:Xaa-Pro aminopeptidase
LRRDLDTILSENEIEALFLYSDSYKDNNMFFLTDFLTPDPFIFLKKTNEDPLIVINQMEYPRAKKQSLVKDVRSYFNYDYFSIMKSKKSPQRAGLHFLTNIIKKEFNHGEKICVPPDFPLIVADFLRSKGLIIKPMFGVIERARETKDLEEIKTIKEIQKINEKVTSEIIDLIRNCDTGNNKTLLLNNEILTVGKIKSLFGKKLLQNGCLIEQDIIVACGPKSSDPHYVGKSEDELKADQPIILDIYPRSLQKRLWTDMTRTVVKGKASKKIIHMFDTISEAKNASFDSIQTGELGSQVYNICCKILEKRGYETSRKGKKVTRGMPHSLGHGVGLQIHEKPRIGEFSNFSLKEHAIVTIEPGLYDPIIGGVRLEDIIEITKNGYRNLTEMETLLEI